MVEAQDTTPRRALFRHVPQPGARGVDDVRATASLCGAGRWSVFSEVRTCHVREFLALADGHGGGKGVDAGRKA